MPRATTATLRPVPAPPPDAPERIAAATIALLAAIEGAPAASPAATAYRSALRRKGQDLAKAGGPSALADVLARVRTANTARADAREAVLTAAWAGLAGWGA
ncbi:MAG: hypothetical protein EOO66_17960 [Methylobacterium sp.]|nr:MAG: hypothetical protein EOO66_17960 [Methylobacterium sp.]